ncbi:MAG: hypothetical protein CMQ27_02480 [Gammaproteobacteria bacterium]|nr:hypothetical protein [Gammaproteobacteria bacterium]
MRTSLGKKFSVHGSKDRTAKFSHPRSLLGYTEAVPADLGKDLRWIGDFLNQVIRSFCSRLQRCFDSGARI